VIKRTQKECDREANTNSDRNLSKQLEMAKNLKWVLTCFEQVSGMKVNYNKSELVPINLDDNEIAGFKEVFDCVVGSFPIKYLGVPLHHEKLRREDLQPIIDKILKRIAGWRGKLLSHAARVLLVKACLASIPIYLLSFFKFPKWALNLINTQMANCLWNDTKDKRKLHLANWHIVCMPKSQGGLGIPYLRDVNICLLASWLKRYINGDGKLWKELVDSKYNTKNPNIFACIDTNSSKFWKGFIWALNAVRLGYRWKVGDGKQIRFWEDTWFGTSPLSVQFWDMYCICNEKMATISQIWDSVNVKLTFRRNFNTGMMENWFELVEICKSIDFSPDCDALIWAYNSDGQYSTSSLYNIISHRGITPIFVPAVWSLVRSSSQGPYFLVVTV
jgi:hypothetical protein